MKNIYEKALYFHFALELNCTPLFFCCGLFIKITLQKGIPLHHKTVPQTNIVMLKLFNDIAFSKRMHDLCLSKSLPTEINI